MYTLESTTVIQAVENRLREWLPDISIARPWATGGVRFETRALNIFTEMGGEDFVTGMFLNPNDAQVFPYLFIEILDRNTIRREKLGLIERFFYDYFINVRAYLGINPFDRERLPRLNEELTSLDLQLERVLQEIPAWDGIIRTENRKSAKVDGALHFFFNVQVYEDTIPEPISTVEAVDINMKLKTISRDGWFPSEKVK